MGGHWWLGQAGGVKAGKGTLESGEKTLKLGFSEISQKPVGSSKNLGVGFFRVLAGSGGP